MGDEEIDEELEEELEEDDEDYDPDDEELNDEELDVEVEDDEELIGSKDDYSEDEVEEAVKANPKRQKAHKKVNKVIKGVASEAELARPEGQERAWETLNEEIDLTRAFDYSVGIEIHTNDVLNHPTFGIGFVIGELSQTKVKVLFEDGLRKLVCKNN